MKGRRIWSRRALIGTAVAGASLAGRALAQDVAPADRGIGGTGVVPTEPVDGDRGIGGTGVIGTIRRFGSIVVNDLRITFPRTVRVRIDGRRAALRDLEIGHVVQVLAHRRDDRLETRMIEAFSEVVGPIEAVTPDGFTVLGQNVVVADAGTGRRWSLGRWVAVSGLRRLDGAIAASLVARGRKGEAQVTGVPHRDPDGTTHIEGLSIVELDDAMIGRRVRIEGRMHKGSLVPDHAYAQWSDLLAARPKHLSIEDYVALDRTGMRLGSGLPVSGQTRTDLEADGARAVLSATVARDGAIHVEHVRAEGRGSSTRGAGPGSHGPEGRRVGAPANEGSGSSHGRPAFEGMPAPERGTVGRRGPGAESGGGHGRANGFDERSSGPMGGGSGSGRGTRSGGGPGDGSHR